MFSSRLKSLFCFCKDEFMEGPLKSIYFYFSMLPHKLQLIFKIINNVLLNNMGPIGDYASIFAWKIEFFFEAFIEDLLSLICF